MKKKRTKRTNSESEVYSESYMEISTKKKKYSSIKNYSMKKRFDILTLEKISYEARTVASNELESPRMVTASKRLSFYMISNTKSIDPPCSIYACVPLLPLTFFDWVHYESKCKYIEEFLKKGVKKQDIIDWIEDNNRLNHEIETNCQLLAEIHSYYFWGVIVHEMLHDVCQFSPSLGSGYLSFVTYQKDVNKKLYIKRNYCYILLLQWFFGLIPPQYHLLKSDAHCTFAAYMYQESYSEMESKNILTSSDKLRLNKLKAIISYFSFMSIEENQTKLKYYSIIIGFTEIKTKYDFYLNPDKNRQNKTVICYFYEDFGTIGDYVLSEVQLKTYRFPQEMDKINSGEMAFQMKKIYSFFYIGSVFSEYAFQDYKPRSYLYIFLLYHPEAFITKLLLNAFTDYNTMISVRYLRRWSICNFSNDGVLQGNYRRLLDNSKAPKFFSRLILVRRENDEYLSIKDYSYERLKFHVEKYINAIKASIRGYQGKLLSINLNYMRHKDIYLNFLLLWVALSHQTQSKCGFLLDLTSLDKSTRYSIEKLYNYFLGKYIGYILSVIKGYEEFFFEKKKLFSSFKGLSFLNFVKRHVF